MLYTVPMNNKKTAISGAAVIAVAAAIFAVASMNRANNAPTITVSLPSTPATDTATSRYKNGTYTATGSYRSPGGLDNVGVTLTLKNDIIISVSFTPMAHDGISAQYQTMFAGGFQSLVLGKNISSVYLDAVSGSSLTGQGFNDALAQIKAQAKA